jgi:protein phosphatase 2C family protein 2/3
VLCRRGKGLELSCDHKPFAEAARITAAGGFVDTEGYLNGVVSVSRALGDWHLTCENKRRLKAPPLDEGATGGDPAAATAAAPAAGRAASLLIAEPDVVVHQLTPEDEFLVLGCDGLWDVLSSQGAVEFARAGLRQHNNPSRLADELAKEALRRNSGDNVTCVVVCFTDEPPPSRPPPLSSRQGSRLFRSISQEALADLQRHLNGDDVGAQDPRETGSPLAVA